MKLTKTIRLLISGLLVLAFTSACGAAQDAEAVKLASNAADEIALAASKAARAAEEAQIAEQAAKNAKNAEEVTQLLRQADEASQQAQQAAEEARTWQQEIEDLKLKQQVAADVQRAEDSAERAKFSQEQIDEIINSLPSVRLRSSVDSIVNRIAINGPDQEQTRELLTGVITASLCDTVIQTWSDGELPGLDEVENVVAENAAKAALELAGLPDIAGEILSEANRIANGQSEDTLKRYKDACETALAQ